jgi:cbb3-type cytochrome oxidase subunit 3
MTYFLFVGDMLVMLFMIGVVVWVCLRSSRKDIEDTARIPLDDEGENG